MRCLPAPCPERPTRNWATLRRTARCVPGTRRITSGAATHHVVRDAGAVSRSVSTTIRAQASSCPSAIVHRKQTTGLRTFTVTATTARPGLTEASPPRDPADGTALPAPPGSQRVNADLQPRRCPGLAQAAGGTCTYRRNTGSPAQGGVTTVTDARRPWSPGPRQRGCCDQRQLRPATRTLLDRGPDRPRDSSPSW